MQPHRIKTTSNPAEPFRFFVNGIVWVEIYYTEDVPLEYGELSPITAVGAGTSRTGGLPHNKSCRTCNLYPDSSPSNNVKELKDRQAINQHDQHDNNTTKNTSNPSSMLGTNQSAAIARTSYSPQNFNKSKSSNIEVVPGKVNSSADHSRAGQARAQLDKKILVIVLSDEEDEKKEETQTRILQKAFQTALQYLI
uniref:Uncharacterized protein n=1 Tax=Ditylenchus dipsaci TaxID=166011 RepID=A0A915EQ01_9BILA